ncbi:TetR/AcrR family transcriptional regulator [Crassaminicella thermophila]|uniref:TetR/AcrR family transcriptional regulator n=1 Tax=Crassaminicella thermophila TaxID=2599308 RepID=UPI00143D12B7|nr:TetR/AcrR family transcriptional regulator [Crassaminicella thermophila]
MNTKNKIINSAIKNFFNLGYEKTSLSLIASEVGIKKPSIYYHFKNKEELFILSINHILDSLEDQILTSIKKVDSSKAMLENIFSCLIEFNSNLSIMVGNNYNKPINMLNLFHLGRNRFPSLGERIDNYYNFLNDTITNIVRIGQKNNKIRTDLSEESLALEIIAWLEGLFMLSTIYSSFNINSIRQNLYDNMWKMISAEATPKTKTKKSFFKKKSFSKTISLGTKW